MRVLRTKVGVDVRYLEQVTTVSGPDRDPRGWSISTAYYALLPGELVPAAAGASVKAIDWRSPVELQDQLAFDHGFFSARYLFNSDKKCGKAPFPCICSRKNLR
jgi:8-oxo-dGTP diphosphatase